MDIVQQTYGLNQNDQVSNEHNQISRYVDMTANNSNNSTMDSLNSPQTELIVSNDKLKQNFSQIQPLSNSFNSILSDKENLNYFDQSSNNHNSHNKSLSINPMENSSENDHFSHSSVNPPSSLSSPSSSSSSSPSLHNLHHHQRQQKQQTNDDSFDSTDKDEHGIRRKRRKQILPQQNFQFTPLIINTDGIQLTKSSEKDETTDITDCDVIDITDTGCPQKVRKLSGSFVDDTNNNNSENKEQIIEGDEEKDKLDIMTKRYDENESKANKIINQSLSPNLLMSSECNKLINELSHCAVEVFRRSLNSKSTKVQINLTDEGDNRDTNCDTAKNNIIEEKMIEQTLLKLEPHISELVGQSLRSSIETLKNEMFASLKSINMNSNEDKHLIEKLTVDKNYGKPKDSNEAGIRNTATTIGHSVDKFTNDAIKTSSPIIQNQINLKIDQSSSEDDLKQSLTFENIQMEQFDPSSLYQPDKSDKEVFQNSTENDCATVMSSAAGNPSISTLTTNKTFSSKGFLGFPVDSLTESSIVNNSNTDANIINNTQNGHISSSVMTDFSEQIKNYINEIKQKFPQFSPIFPCENEDSTIFPKTICNDLSAGNINQQSSSTQFTATTTINGNNNSSNDISSDQPNVISSVEMPEPFTLNANITSSSTPLCGSPLPPTQATAATPAAAAAALANVLGFPNPFGWPSKLLTNDTQDNFGLTNSLSNLWPWKLLNSPYALKCPDQNTLIQPNPLINNAINLFSQLNKVNADPTLTNCLNSRFSSNQEGKYGSNENASLHLTTPIVTTLDEQLEAMPLVVRHERKANKTNSSIINNNTTYNNSNANNFDKLLSSITTEHTTSNATNTPTTGIASMNETGIFHGSTIGRRRRTKVTDTRLTHPRVSRYSSNTLSNCLLGNSTGITQAVYQQQSSFPQTTTGVIDSGTAMNLITPTNNGIPMCTSGGKALQLDDKESSLLNNNLLTGLNLSKYRHFINTSINNNSNNMKLDDFTSVKYRSENQIHSSGSNNSSPSPISLRLSGNAKEFVDTDGNRLNQEAERLDGQLPGESEKSTEYNTTTNNNNNINNNDRLNDKHSPHDYESFERIFTKTFKNYPLSMKSNLTNNSGAVSGGISSPLSSTSSPIHFNNTNMLLTETNVISPISSISTSIMSHSSSSSVSMSDINQRRILSKFNPICLLNSRLSNPLPPIPPIFFDSADDIPNKNTSNNATQRPSMNITNDNVHSYLGVQNEGPENQNPQQQSFSQRSNLSNCPNSSHSLPSFIHNSTSSYSLPLKSSLFPISQSLSLGPLDTSSNFTNTTTATIPGNTYESSINSNTSCITTISNLQNSHHRRQQQQSQPTPSNSNPHAQHNHHHMNYINKLYDKLNSGENLFNMKINKTMLLSDTFNNESNGMTLSESYQNQLINCSHELRMTTTLTPVHLRKAKLMFFYTRYPNSTLIKMYFPDVKFYKNNTAQLVKWFSNFREFYYIQMEKYARVAISEGIRTAEEIHVTTESEIYRALNLHYNRNQQLEVPDHFRIVVEATLREFFVALYTGKDSEQSWKKPIYKVIARMDQPVPEFFKSPNWMDQLADG
uniref:Prospero domain-containing protein n=1 Tax=Trichobilharzia regenti TaxID=157069 RepID=A0AA85JJ70_TRIRE|nr:unnamed protein product [Trichobilharzia regenti]